MEYYTYGQEGACINFMYVFIVYYVYTGMSVLFIKTRIS